MMKTSSLSFLLAVSLFGCANDRSDDGLDEGSGSDPLPDPPRKVDAQGTYRVHSTFDVATNMPGGSGTVVNGLIAATDDPDDPMSWLLDQMLAKMPSGTFKTVLQGAKPFVAGALNDQVTNLAPELVGTIVEIGQRMKDLTKELGVNEKLAVTLTDQVYLGRVTADGVRFKVDGTFVDAAFIDHDIDDVIVDGVYIKLENENHLDIALHSLPLPYGKIVRLGLDAAIVPAIDPTATSLTDLLDNVVNCQAVGQNIADSLDVGSAAFWQAACLGGLQYAADLVYEQIAASDSSLDLHISGEARAADTDADYKLDKITFGKWSGTMTYSGTDANLADPATFVGARM